MTTVEPAWRRSTRCETSSCVEVAKVDGWYLVRDSKAPDQPALTLTDTQWLDFVGGIQDGDFVDL